MKRDEALHILKLAQAADASAGADEASAAALRDLGDKIVPAIEYLIEGDRPAALRLVGALATYWQDAGRVDEGRALTERAIRGSDPAGNRDVLRSIPRALLAASDLAFRQGDQEQATKRAKDCIRAAVLIDDYVTASLAHSNLARVAYRAGDAAEIERQSRKALDLAGDDTLANRAALHMLAWAAHTAGDLDEAERRFEASLDYRRRFAGRLSVAVEIANLGDLAAERGDLPRAAQLLAEVIEISHELDSKYMLVNSFPACASLCVRAGIADDGARLFGAADAIANASGLVPDPNTVADEARASARELVGDRFASLLAEGARLSEDDAVALALRVTRALAVR
jgi:tetratricopeptide (TPR) repeat protein